MPVTQILIEYAGSIRKQLLANPTNIEQDLAPVFKALLEKLLPHIPITDLTVTSVYAKAGIGRPDIALTRPGQPPRAFECGHAVWSGEIVPAKAIDPKAAKRIEAMFIKIFLADILVMFHSISMDLRMRANR